MIIKRQNCKLKKINLFNQQISLDEIKTMLYNVYNNICFSTFPYLIYKESHSKSCIEKFNSGNCIAFCYFIKLYLQQNHNITSYIIGASVPDMYKIENTPHICHCAVLIPISSLEFYIIDCALYFTEPIYIHLRYKTEGEFITSNAFEHINELNEYKLHNCKGMFLDTKYKQILQPDTLAILCNFKDDKLQYWNYYLNELENPDNNVGHSFLSNKKEPFLLNTKFENGIVKLNYKLKLNGNNVSIKKYPERQIIFDGNLYENNENFIKIKNQLNKYFLNNIF